MIIYAIGTGAAEGTPLEGLSPRDVLPFEKRRNSTYVYVSSKEKVVGIDAGVNPYYHFPRPFEGLLLTHWQSDHYAGLFPLRYYRGLKVYAPPGRIPFDGGTKSMKIHFPEPYEFFEVGDFQVAPVVLRHSKSKIVYGYVIKDDVNTVYHLSNTKCLPEETLDFLKKLGTADAVIVDATFLGSKWGGKEEDNHNNLDEALEIGTMLGKQVWLTHIPPYAPGIVTIHSWLRENGFENVFIAYDGAIIQP